MEASWSVPSPFRQQRRPFHRFLFLAFALTSLNFIVHRYLSFSFDRDSDIDTNVDAPRSGNSTVGHKHTDGYIEEEDKDDPFAKQNPQGTLWKSPKDNTAGYWWRNSDSCFEVDNICRSSRNKWFYYYNKSSPHNLTPSSFQPTLELKYMPYSYTKGTWADVRVKLEVLSISRVPGGAWHDDGDNCQISSVANHVVLQSLFNDMVGEFYGRTLSNVYELLVSNNAQTNSIRNISAPKEEMQFYIHIPLENRQILDAHRLLLAGILPPTAMEPKNNTPFHSIRWAKTALDLVRPQKGARSCQCFKKLVFCGYRTYFQKDYGSRNGHINHPINQTALPPSSLDDRLSYNYTLWPGQHVDSSGVNRGEFDTCNPVDSNFQNHSDHCRKYAKLRGHLLKNIGSHYPSIDGDVTQHRRTILLGRKLIDENYGGDTKEWTFVGLAQRSSRRSWVNLSNVTQTCDAAFLRNTINTRNVICLEINVEQSESPQEQLIVHRSLDALIGIHGAQLTQAILLRPNSHVLELLPWIPHYARGHWTKATKHPTPLGIIFHNSDLNHFGYSLDRSSVPLCENVPVEGEKLCFTSKENERKFDWANRDFTVDADVVIHFISKFVLPMKKPCQCKDLLDAQGKRFVLYNILCEHQSGATTNNITVRHYFRETVSNNSDERELPFLQMCQPPQQTPTWNYYLALVHENADMADRARQLTDNPVHVEDKEEDLKPRIPHRLIFTHKDNLFDCSKSASMSTSPDLYSLSENAKATVNAYSKTWPDLEFKFLTDKDCLEALNQTQPGLIPWFNSGLVGMFKADLCRAAYLYLYGGYYFDVDLLVVRPFVAPNNATFVTVKGEGFPRDGFFQAFAAAEKGNGIVHRSLQIMEEALYGDRPQGKYLGPTALMEAWLEVTNINHPLNVDLSVEQNLKYGVYLLTEVSMISDSISKYKSLSNAIAKKDGVGLMQRVPKGHGDDCQFSSGACNAVVIDESSNETLYFYSRVLGTKWCGKRTHEHGECPQRVQRGEVEVTLSRCSNPYLAGSRNITMRGFGGTYPVESLPKAYTCTYNIYDEPYLWERRLKSRLFSRIIENSLTDCEFGGLDVGTAAGDWVIAVGSFARKSNFAAYEASPKTFASMVQNLDANPGLMERVLAYNAAAVSHTTVDQLNRSSTELNDSSANWTGPTLCITDGDTDGRLKVKTESITGLCPSGEAAVPAIPIDTMMLDWDVGKEKDGMLFAKLDIEGGEYDALLGGSKTFSSNLTRPCFIYIEVKRGSPIYDHFSILNETYGYAVYEDLDSGLIGRESFPPKGSLWDGEGNYELRLPGEELAKCIERVRRVTCAAKASMPRMQHGVGIGVSIA